MAGGQVATRGFLLQTLIAIFDTLESLELLKSLRLEPDTVNDKTDIVWEFKDGTCKATQVKSSQNQIGLPDVKRWASALKKDVTADEYSIVLIGPCSEPLTQTSQVDGVLIPIAKSLDIAGMIQQASHLLDHYFQRSYMGTVPPGVRELIVEGLIGKLTTYSTAGTMLSAAELERLLREWLLCVYPNAIQKALNQQVEFVCDSFTLVPIAGRNDGKLFMLFPFTVLNDGLRPAVVEWIVVRFTTDTGSWMYTPILLVDYTAFIQGNSAISNSNTLSNFRPCVIRKSDVAEIAVLFGPETGDPVPDYSKWKDMYFQLDIMVKYRGSDLPVSAMQIHQTIPGVAIEQYFNETKPSILVRRNITF